MNATYWLMETIGDEDQASGDMEHASINILKKSMWLQVFIFHIYFHSHFV